MPRAIAPVIVSLLLLVLTAPLVGCGDDPEPTLDELLPELDAALATKDEKQTRPVLEQIGELGRANPETVVPDLIERLRAERAEGPMRMLGIEIDYRDSGLTAVEQRDDLRRVVDIMIKRREFHFPRGSATVLNEGVGADGVGRVFIRTPRSDLDAEAEHARLSSWVRIFAESGSIGLWAVAERPGSGGMDSLWPGDAASYDAFVAEHTNLLKEMAKEGRLGQSGNDAFRLAMLAPSAAGEPIRKVVLVVPKNRHETFDADDLELAGFGDPKSLEHVLEIRVERRKEHLRAWLEKHAGRRMALVVNDRAEFVIPVPKADVSFPIHIGFGPMNDKYVLNWLQGVVRAARPGWVRYPLEGSVVPGDPHRLDTPIALSLVAVGMPALEAVQALQAESGPIVRRSRWIAEQIVRGETGTGRGHERPKRR